MSNLKKATLEALLAHKEQAQASKMQYVEIDVPSMGMTFTVERQPLTRILNLIDRYRQNGATSLVDNLEMYKDLIYNSVPLMKSKQLHEAYAPKIPTDIVTMVFDENLQAITELGDAIGDLYGVNNGGAVEEVKN